MGQIKQYFRAVFELLITRLLSSCLAVLRLIKYILKREVKKEESKSIKPAPIADSEVSPLSSPTAEEPETQTIEPEGREPAPIADSEVSPLLSPTAEPETQTIEPESSTSALEATEAYCAKCRQKRAIQGARKVTTPKGRRAVEGTCPVCGTKLFRFIARKAEL